MSWKDLLQKPNEKVILPWFGGRTLRSSTRTWKITGRLPQEHAWHVFLVQGRTAILSGTVEQETCKEALSSVVKGYLVGDRLVLDSVQVASNPATIAANSERVYFIEPGLDRFSRVVAGRICTDGNLIFEGQDMPLGPEVEVLEAFENKASNLSGIKGVSPALDAAFRFESWRRIEIEKRRQEEMERQRLEQERLVLEERRRQIVERLGDAAGRRELAVIDFAEAARAALAVGGAEYLDHRVSHNRNEMVVKFRLDGRRLECTCDQHSLRIIDSGICLTAHNEDDGFEEGTRGDSFFTLESLPSVIQEADREGRLVVYRHG